MSNASTATKTTVELKQHGKFDLKIPDGKTLAVRSFTDKSDFLYELKDLKVRLPGDRFLNIDADGDLGVFVMTIDTISGSYSTGGSTYNGFKIELEVVDQTSTESNNTTSNHDPEIKIGGIVYLKSGSPKLTAHRFGEGNKLTVVWWVEGKKEWAEFPIECLTTDSSAWNGH